MHPNRAFHDLTDEAAIALAAEIAFAHIPAVPWTRAKMDPARFDAMRKAITGFEVEFDAVRVTRKLSQNKPVSDRIGVVRGLEAAGNHGLAAAMQALP